MSDILVQRGRNDIGNSGGTDTGFTAVSALTAAFEFNGNNLFTHGGSTSSGGNMECDDAGGRIELTAVGTLTFSRIATSLAQNMRFDWELVEYTGAASGANEFIVRSRNTITMSGASNTVSLDVTPTNIDKCVPFITGVTNTQTSNSGDHLRVLAYINDSGSLVVERGNADNDTVVQVVVVEFTGSNWEVFHGTATSSADTGSITLNTDSDAAGGSTGDVSDWSTAFIVGGFTSTDGGLDSIACTYGEGTGTTAVAWTFNSGNSTSHKHFVHVVKNADMSVTRYTPTGSAANDTNVDITSAGLTDISEAMIIGTCEGSGGGTAYQRNWRNYSLTSTTNARHYCHRSGNTINHNIQVIDFANVEDSGGTPITINATSTVGAGVDSNPTVTRSRGMVISASSNIAASGENTTRQLNTPASKSTGDFDAGRIQDDENPTDAISLGLSGWTEIEFAIKAESIAGNDYKFRLTIDGVPLDTLTQIPVVSVVATGTTINATSTTGAGVDPNASIVAEVDKIINASSSSGVGVTFGASIVAEIDTIIDATSTIAAGVDYNATIVAEVDTVILATTTVGVGEDKQATIVAQTDKTIEATSTVGAGVDNQATIDAQVDKTINVGSTVGAGVDHQATFELSISIDATSTVGVGVDNQVDVQLGKDIAVGSTVGVGEDNAATLSLNKIINATSSVGAGLDNPATIATGDTIIATTTVGAGVDHPATIDAQVDTIIDATSTVGAGVDNQATIVAEVDTIINATSTESVGVDNAATLSLARVINATTDVGVGVDYQATIDAQVNNDLFATSTTGAGVDHPATIVAEVDVIIDATSDVGVGVDYPANIQADVDVTITATTTVGVGVDNQASIVVQEDIVVNATSTVGVGVDNQATIDQEIDTIINASSSVGVGVDNNATIIAQVDKIISATTDVGAGASYTATILAGVAGFVDVDVELLPSVSCSITLEPAVGGDVELLPAAETAISTQPSMTVGVETEPSSQPSIGLN